MTIYPHTQSQTNSRNKFSGIAAYKLNDNCYINLTNRCFLRCSFCPRTNNQWDVRGYNLRLNREPSVHEVIDQVGSPEEFREIVFCGLGEPTLRLNELIEIAGYYKGLGCRIRVNTSGTTNWQQYRDVTSRFSGIIDAFSISMNAQNMQVHDKICRPRSYQIYPSMMEFIKCIRKYCSDVTITAIRGLPDVDIHACKKIADDLCVKFYERQLDEVG